MCRATNEDLLRMVELLSKEKATKDVEEHTAKIYEVTAKVKARVFMALWEEKIKLKEDMVNVGSWNLAGWHEALAKLNVNIVNISQDPEG